MRYFFFNLDLTKLLSIWYTLKRYKLYLIKNINNWVPTPKVNFFKYSYLKAVRVVSNENNKLEGYCILQ